MPTLAIIDGIKIAMYYADHEPAHFHAIAGEDEVVITIANLQLVAGAAPPAILRRVRTWARRHQQRSRYAGSAAAPGRSREGSIDDTADHPQRAAAAGKPDQTGVG
jgi:hypothetical protein